MAKLWGGRFDGKNEAWIDAFGASISFDQQLAAYALQGSIAHVKMLKKRRFFRQKMLTPFLLVCRP